MDKQSLVEIVMDNHNNLGEVVHRVEGTKKIVHKAVEETGHNYLDNLLRNLE